MSTLNRSLFIPDAESETDASDPLIPSPSMKSSDGDRNERQLHLSLINSIYVQEFRSFIRAYIP